MSNKFLSGGADSGASLTALADGTFAGNMASLKLQDLTPGTTLRANGDKLIVSSQIGLGDLNFVPLSNPYAAGDLQVTAGDVISLDVQTSTVPSLNAFVENTETALADAEGDILTLAGKTQYQSASASTTTFAGRVRATRVGGPTPGTALLVDDSLDLGNLASVTRAAAVQTSLLQTDTLQTNFSGVVALNSNVEGNSRDILNVGTISAGTVSATFVEASTIQNPTPATPITLASPLNVLGVSIEGASQVLATTIGTDNLAPLSGPDVLLGGNLDFANTYSLLRCPTINGIQPSGGLYSESSGFVVLAANLAETDLLGQGASAGSLSVPANGFDALSMYSFKASGVLSGGANDLFTLRAKTVTGIPSTVLLGSIAVQLGDNGLVDRWWDISIDFSIRTTGVAGVAVVVLTGAFRYTNNNDVVSTFGRTFVVSSGFDTTTSNALALTFQNDATNPLTSFRIDQASFTKWF